jgi:hypothetical protein
MVDLMKTFMFFHDCPFILQFIQEILGFKFWFNGYLNDGLFVLVGHMEMHLFWFFVDEVGWSVIQYKISPIDGLWSPKDGPTI